MPFGLGGPKGPVTIGDVNTALRTVGRPEQFGCCARAQELRAQCCTMLTGSMYNRGGTKPGSALPTAEQDEELTPEQADEWLPPTEDFDCVRACWQVHPGICVTADHEVYDHCEVVSSRLHRMFRENTVGCYYYTKGEVGDEGEGDQLPADREGGVMFAVCYVSGSPIYVLFMLVSDVGGGVLQPVMRPVTELEMVRTFSPQWGCRPAICFEDAWSLAKRTSGASRITVERMDVRCGESNPVLPVLKSEVGAAGDLLWREGMKAVAARPRKPKVDAAAKPGGLLAGLRSRVAQVATPNPINLNPEPEVKKPKTGSVRRRMPRRVKKGASAVGPVIEELPAEDSDETKEKKMAEKFAAEPPRPGKNGDDGDTDADDGLWDSSADEAESGEGDDEESVQPDDDEESVQPGAAKRVVALRAPSGRTVTVQITPTWGAYDECAICQAAGKRRGERQIPHGAFEILRASKASSGDIEHCHIDCWSSGAGPVKAELVPGWDEAVKYKLLLSVRAKNVLETGTIIW